MQPFGYNTWFKIGAVPLLFYGGGAGSPFNTMSHGLKSTSVPSGILIYQAVWTQQTWAGRKLGAVPPFLWGELGPYLTQCGRARGLPSCQVSS